MPDYRFLEENADRIRRSLKARSSDFVLEDVEALGKKRRELQAALDAKRSEMNTVSGEIGKIYQSKTADRAAADSLKQKASTLKSEVDRLQAEHDALEGEVGKKLLYLPNALHDSVPEGSSSEQNQEVRRVGEPKVMKDAKTHDELGQRLGILDFERATKVSGARFAFLTGLGARLERALLNFMMDTHLSRGYEEIWPPTLLLRAAMEGTGQLPKFEEEAFRVADPEFYLSPTAEVPVTNFYRDEILSEKNLPKSFAAFSACFRREAGSYGRDTKGLIRQHQFDKVELVKFSTPEDSYNQLEKMLTDAEEILKRLEIPYRVVSLCSGDIGFAASKTYDIEVWLPGQNTYREISSCSNCEDFQARRASIRYKSASGGKPRYVHTLNGSGLALGRTWIAVVENYQNPDGSIRIPKALHPYMAGAAKIDHGAR